MASYGRNFDYRILPRAEARNGRFVAPSVALSGANSSGGGAAGTGLIPIGAPVVWDLSAGQDGVGRQYVKLATAGATVTPESGVLVYEYGPAAYAGVDPYLTTYSDLSVAPLGAPIQLVAGDPAAKIVLTNTPASSFLGVRSYPGRTMVNGLGATATVAIGDYLIPGSGDDVDGYWETTATATGAWAVITSVDTLRAEVEARMLF